MKKKRGKAGIVVLALMLLAFGCYTMATEQRAGGWTWLSVTLGFLLVLPMLPKRLLGLRPKVVCKFCHVAGQVFVHRLERKRGISGGKATGALLTCGLSLLATGLSRKEVVASLRCENCGMKWDE